MSAYPHYFKQLPPGCTHLDVYRVLALFDVTDPALQHAVKKLLCAGARGAKDQAQDIAEAIATLQRWQQMREEESTPAEDPGLRKAPWPDFAGNQIFEGDWIVHPSGERARVRFDPDNKYAPGWSEWRCDYEDGELDMALALQIGDRGLAVVAVEPRPKVQP
jgi:hypothetical protein